VALNKLGKGSLIVVPGIMGSGLRHTGRDSNGVQRNEVVWGDQVSVMWRTLARSPELLGSPHLEPTQVIREVKMGVLSVRHVYGPLLEFCTSNTGLGLTLNTSLWPFPYDWRRDLTDTASKLAELVERVPQPVFIVAHSMGGLVARLMLNLHTNSATRVKGVFQIASPIIGSSNAFITLKRHPSLGSIADPLLNIYHKLDPTKQAKLMDALGNMQSLYQLLPPDHEKILLQYGGTQRSAMDLSAWLPRDHAFIAAANDVHKQLATTPSVPLKCIYAVQLDTDWLLAVDNNWNLVGTKVTAEGDGTVTSASAYARSIDIRAFRGRDAEHTKLCSRNDVHQELRGFLS
jgi:pimeloyl-ACP methyl ester carboxylesterase